MNEVIRFARVDDSERILEIYSEYILHTAITFEIEVPTEEAFKKRVENIMNVYPYLVYEVDNIVVGYAYASKYRERAAFCYDVDLSIYFEESSHGKGRAKLLYDCLMEILTKQGYYNTYVAYLDANISSAVFHKKLGFEKVGTFKNVGYKFDMWHDVTWATKPLQSFEVKPKELISIQDIDKDFLEKLIIEYNNKINL